MEIRPCKTLPLAARQSGPRVLSGTMSLILFTLLMAGCGGQKYSPVTGSVLLNGEPLENAKLIFEPIGDDSGNASGSPSYGRTDAEGRFTVRCPVADREGAAIGEHRVRIVTATAPEYTDQQRTQAREVLREQEAAGGNTDVEITDDMVNAFLSDNTVPTFQETLPAKYNSDTELRFVVETSGNEATFELVAPE